MTKVINTTDLETNDPRGSCERRIHTQAVLPTFQLPASLSLLRITKTSRKPTHEIAEHLTMPVLLISRGVVTKADEVYNNFWFRMVVILGSIEIKVLLVDQSRSEQ